MEQPEEPPHKSSHQQHPEEVEHHENSASKMFRKVKARARKFRNSITNNHGQSHEHDHDVVEEDDDDDEIEEVIDSPGGVKGKHESLSHPRDTNVPAPEEIVPPGTKVFPVVSSDHSKPIESVPLQDTSYGYEVPAHSVRTTDRSDKEERRDVPTHHPLSEREESSETHHESLNTPVSLVSGTEDIKRPVENDYLGGHRKVNFESPKKLEDDLAIPGGGSNYQSKVTDPTKEGSEVSETTDSLGRMNVSDEFSDQKSAQGFDRDLSTRSKEFREFDQNFSTRSKEFDQDFDSVLGKDSSAKSHTEYGIDKNSPAGFGGGGSGAELEKDSSTRSHDFDMKTESGLDNKSPSRSYEFDLKTESGSPMEFRSESGAELEKELPRGSNEFDQKVGSGRNEYSPESDGGLGAPMGGNFPVRSHELDLKDESVIDKDTPTGFDGEPDFLAEGRPGYGEDPEEEKNFPARSDHDVKLETELGRDVPTGTHDQFSPELSRPKEKDETNFPVRSDHDVKLETVLGRDVPMTKLETVLGRDVPTTGTHEQFSPELSRPKERDEFEESRDDFEETTQEAKPSTYTEKFASMLGHSGESPVGDQTDQVAGTVDEKLTPVNEKEKETESAVTPKLPLSGGGSGLEETEQVEDKDVSGKDYLAEKLTPAEEDKALSEVMAEKLKIGAGEDEKKTTTKEVEVEVEKIPTEKLSEEGQHGEAVEEEAKGGGMVGMIKGWFGGAATEEVKPNSPHSVEEAPKSPGWFGGGAREEVKPRSPHSVEEAPKSAGWFGGGATEEVKPKSPHSVEEAPKSTGWFGGGATEEVKPKSPLYVEEAPKSTGWFGGGATEEVKPKSPHSVEESPQSLGSTVGTKGFPDSGASGLGGTDGGGGAVPVQKGL